MLKNTTKLIAIFITAVLFMGCASLSAQTDRDEYRQQAIEILESVPLFDGHNDAPYQYRNRVGYKFSELDFYDTTQLENPMHTDIPRLKEGYVGAQWWSVYVPASIPEDEAVKRTMEQIDFVYRMAEKYPDEFEMAYTADDVERIFAEGKIASLIGMEGGHSISNSLATLRMFYDLGARYMTITHSRTLDWADAAGDEPQHDGLSEFGEEVIREMNRLGMAVDLSHVTPATMKDAIELSEAPVMFSHSNARAISNHPRNVPDDVLALLPEKDGLVMVTFVESFTSEELRQWYAERSGYLAKMESLYPGQPDIISEMMDEWSEENEMPKSTLEQVADHIDHIRDQVGVDHIGIGGDYDGVSSLPTGLEDVSTYPDLFAELLKRGYSEDDLRKIAGENMLRVLRGIEATAERLQQETEPSEVLITDFE
ncbi:dipeptidase [Rhodohalobacter sp.]|uniref:dipeptidase n=1 Tax=Rhodohalobacter sp. TaxID=1974210 RepID=UPI002ACE9791|nr:dipeptidase [Rhodohalobacter sp.]MDZ7758198.1 dipeptidase [Rhodohalobacter sp.]